MTQNLTKYLVNLSNRGFGTNRTAELGFYHREGSLNIRPLVVVGKESIPIEIVEVPHTIPQTVKWFAPLTTFGITFEWDIWYPIHCLNRMEIITARICFISRYFADIECLSSSIDQLGKLGSIGCFSRSYFNASNNVCFDSAHQMGFYPLGFAPHLTPFMVKPSIVGSGCETRRVNGEIGLHGFQGTGTLFNQGFQQWGQFGVFKIAGVAGSRYPLPTSAPGRHARDV